jgi:hypothetical protein
VAPAFDTGDPPVDVLDACSVWPVPPTSQPGEPTVAGDPAVLVVSTTGDPATPYESGVHLAQLLDASLLTVEGTRHTAFITAGLPCVDDAVTEFLVDLTPPADGTTCG